MSALYLFGSRAQGVSGPTSDFDFGILLKDPATAFKSTAELYHIIYPILASVTRPETLEADVIDIVFLDSPRVPLELKSFIVRKGKLLLDDNPSYHADVTSRILLQTADFAPLRHQMSTALFERPNPL